MNHVSEKTPESPVQSPAHHVSLFRRGANQAVRSPNYATLRTGLIAELTLAAKAKKLSLEE